MKRIILMMALIWSVSIANAQNETQTDKQVVDIEQIREKANQGDAEAQFKLGSFYRKGINGVPKDEEQSIILYKKAAESGIPAAAMTLVAIYRQKKDYRETQKWINKAKSLGFPVPLFMVDENKKELAKIAEDSLKAVAEANRPEHEKLIEVINKIKGKPESEQDKDELRILNERLVNLFKQRAIQDKDAVLCFRIAKGYEVAEKRSVYKTKDVDFCDFVQNDDSAMVWYKKCVAFGADIETWEPSLYKAYKEVERMRKAVKMADDDKAKYIRKYGTKNGTALYEGQFTGLSLAQVNEFVKDLNAMPIEGNYFLKTYEPSVADVIRYGRGVQIYKLIVQATLQQVETEFKVLNGKVIVQYNGYTGMKGEKDLLLRTLDNDWVRRVDRLKK